MIEQVQVDGINVDSGVLLHVYGKRVGTTKMIVTVAEVTDGQSAYNLNGAPTARLRVSRAIFDSIRLCNGEFASGHVHQIEYDEAHPIEPNMYPILSYRYCRLGTADCIIHFT